MIRPPYCVVVAALLLLTIFTPNPAHAQVAIGGGIGGMGGAIGGGNIGGIGGGAGGAAGIGGAIAGGGNAAGIKIDAQGVVKPLFVTKKSVALSKQRMEAVSKKLLADDVNQPSQLRKVSLVRLEAACREYVEKKTAVPPDMQFLAGLQRIDYVFVYPAEKDLVIAGPAEGYAANVVGRVVGLSTGRPPLRLDDLIVALWTIQRGGPIGCSIDPEPKRLASLQRYVATSIRAATPKVIGARYRKMRNILGMQNVRIWGVESESHFAEAMLEADYRMKLISVGLEKPGVRGLQSHLSMVGSGGNSMQRWWFTPFYEPFNKSVDGNAYQFAGQRAQLMSQEEQVGASGQRSAAAFTRVSTQRFARNFTDKFPALAAKSAIFAELQNLIDLAVMAALLNKEGLAEKVGWKMSLFLDRERVAVQKGTPPAQVPTVVNFRRARRRMYVGLVGGGVTIDPHQTVRALRFKTDPAARLEGIHSAALQKEPPIQHPWWWD